MGKNNKIKPIKEEAQRSKITVAVYFILRALVIGVMIIQGVHGNWSNVFTCGLALALFVVPSFLEKQLKIDLPDTLEIIILLFIFAAEILGEIQAYYVIFPRWDDMLHTMNGFLCAAIGFALIDILNSSDRVKLKLSPGFVAMVAFCFSMTVGVMWEFFEFAMDYWFGQDMQKDTWLSAFNSVALNIDGENIPLEVIVESATLNGIVLDGHLDVGLHDTMHDLFVNFIGAIAFSILGTVYIKNRGKGFAGKFIPTVKQKGE